MNENKKTRLFGSRAQLYALSYLLTKKKEKHRRSYERKLLGNDKCSSFISSF